MSGTPALWRPTAAQIATAQLTAFARMAAARCRATTGTYAELHAWSVAQRPEFWNTLWDFVDVSATRRADHVLVDGDRMPGARWFVGAQLNFAENLLRRGDDRPALIAVREDGQRRVMSHQQLQRAVASLAAALRERGVGVGNRVAALLPNIPEAMVGALATASIGAVWSSAAPEFGASAIVDRFGQIAPRVLLASNGYRYQGRRIDLRDKVAQVVAAVPSIAHVVVVDDTDGPALALAGSVDYAACLDANAGARLSFEQLPFDHPLYVLYSSGTTGKPKCIVHGAGGTLLQHLKEHRLHVDLRSDDVFFYYTSCGWMMWNWLLSGLASGATLLLYDGHPMAQRAEQLFELAAAEGVAVFGTSAKYLAALEQSGVRPARSHQLPRLRTILSTGSPLLPAQFDYVYQSIKTDLHLASISGGTDIVSCFVLGNPTAPVQRGEIQCAGLGMDVRIFDDSGRDQTAGRGELVCAQAFPSMPIGFWGDDDGSRFRRAYFDRFPNVWAHGDDAECTARGGFVIHGRSDAVLNPGGVRIGTAEIYRVVERIDDVAEALAVAQEWQSDVRVVLFVRLRVGVSLDATLRQRIADELRREASPRHVPARIIQVSDLPRTMNGKLSELAVRAAIHGRPIANREALANPEALAQFVDIDELKR